MVPSTDEDEELVRVNGLVEDSRAHIEGRRIVDEGEAVRVGCPRVGEHVRAQGRVPVAASRGLAAGAKAASQGRASVDLPGLATRRSWPVHR